MARPPKLNWDDARGKWRVVHRGKKYRFDGGTGKSDRDAKKQAEAAWRATKAQLDLEAEANRPHRQEYQAVIQEWTSVLTWAVDHGDELTAAVARDKIRNLEDRLAQRVPPPLAWSDRFFAGPAPFTERNEQMATMYLAERLVPAIEVEGPVPFELKLWQDRLEAQDRRLDRAGNDETFVANVERFLEQKRTKVAAGQLSPARAESLRAHLEFLMDFAGRTSSVSRI